MSESSAGHGEQPDVPAGSAAAASPETVPTRWGAAETPPAPETVPTRWGAAETPPAPETVPTRWGAAETPPAPETVPTRWGASPEHPDMWVDPADDPRDTGADLTDEKSTLTEYLRVYRKTLEMKCADLNAAQLAARSVPPSTMSLLGLIRHMADVERGWFKRTMAGQDVPDIFKTAEDRDADFNGAVGDPNVVAQAWQAWRDEVAFAERFVADAGDLGMVATTRRGGTVSLREVLVHMIEEYARHCGHADLIRERIDGRVGQ